MREWRREHRGLHLPVILSLQGEESSWGGLEAVVKSSSEYIGDRARRAGGHTKGLRAT